MVLTFCLKTKIVVTSWPRNSDEVHSCQSVHQVVSSDFIIKCVNAASAFHLANHKSGSLMLKSVVCEYLRDMHNPFSKRVCSLVEIIKGIDFDRVTCESVSSLML